MSEEEKKAIKNMPNLEGVDIGMALTALSSMTRKQRREWFCKARMSAMGLTFRAMAKKHRVSAFLLSGAVSGKHTWSPRVIKCLEAELKIDLSPFFNDGESRDQKK